MKPHSPISRTASNGDERRVRLGKELRRHREAAGMTQAQLGKRIRKSAAAVSKIEAARQPLDMPTLLAITNELRIVPERLLLDVELARTTLSPLQRRAIDVLRKAIEHSSQA